MDEHSLVPPLNIDQVQRKIHTIYGQRVMLDTDLALLYEVETRTLNQSVKRNQSRFPADFMFQLTLEEWRGISSQFVMRSGISEPDSKQDSTAVNKTKRGLSYRPYAFTEQGVAMLSSVLRSEKAMQMNIAIMRAFIAARQLAATHSELFRQLAELTGRVGEHDVQLSAIYTAIENLLDDKAEQQSWADRERIGFQI